MSVLGFGSAVIGLAAVYIVLSPVWDAVAEVAAILHALG